MNLGEYLRAIIRRAAAERRADDHLDGCDVDHRIADFWTRDHEIDALLIPEDRGKRGPLHGRRGPDAL